NFFIENVLHWFRNFHIDALRLDAIHAIFDMSARHILQEIAETTEEFSKKTNRKFFLIAESDLNDSRVIKPVELGGYGIDSQWCDDFHHSVRTLITGDRDGYYVDYGLTDHLVKSFKDGYVYTGEYSEFRKRKHGNSAKDRHGSQFVVFINNHDQTGNRMFGERLTEAVSFESL
ncbi:MAG: malto-oligosyltrehalose trehalohydrolase, partial [Proteobacteria bacterium]|nr:malto-oligosyltrehalose trehalohydrolase [Pseudomonadota bacterium]